MPKQIALECEVCRAVNFALPIKYFQQTRGLVSNFQQFGNLVFAMAETRFKITAPP